MGNLLGKDNYIFSATGEAVERIADRVFGSKEDVISLIKQGKWEDAAKFGDHVSYRAVSENEGWWWHQVGSLDRITDTDKELFNSVSYGNIAMGVFYGSKFPDRIPIIEKMKSICSRDL